MSKLLRPIPSLFVAVALLTLMLVVTAHLTAVAAGVRETRVLFHAGERAILRENLEAHTVPATAWDKFIMGKTHFDLPEYRKGLYGAETVAGTSLYALYRFLDGGDGWLMAITVKQDCLSPASVHAGGYVVRAEAYDAGRFARWYANHRDRYRKLEKTCLLEYRDFSEWHEGILYSLQKAAPAERALSDRCTPVLDDYLKEEKLKVVFDAVNPASWYLRDRACIEDIRGTPDELFTLILDQKIGDPDESFIRNFWGRIGEPGTYFGGSTLLLVNVLAETSLLAAPALDRIAALETIFAEWLGPVEKNESAPSLDDDEDNVRVARHLLRAARGAIAGSTQRRFQEELRRELSELRADFRKDCQGKFGVPAKKRESCARATAARTALLLRAVAPFEANAH